MHERTLTDWVCVSKCKDVKVNLGVVTFATTVNHLRRVEEGSGRALCFTLLLSYCKVHQLCHPVNQ